MNENPASSDPVLYVIVCGSPPARDVPTFVKDAQAVGWRVCVVPTPTAMGFLDTELAARLSDHPVRSSYKHPAEPDVLPSADAYIVAPATFNTVNKIAQGITDTLGVGLVCEGIGYGRPVIIVPWLNRALARHSAYGRNVDQLVRDGVDVVLTEATTPKPDEVTSEGQLFPWGAAIDRVARVRAGFSE